VGQRDEQIRNFETTGKPIRTLTIYSPAGGYVLQKMAVQGMRVMPGEKLFDIVDLSSVWIVADIYEYELPLIKVGQPARIGLSYFPGKEFSSRVDYVYPALAGETRTAKVRFTVPNPGDELKPQMFTNVEIRINLKPLAVRPSGYRYGGAADRLRRQGRQISGVRVGPSMRSSWK
jgi:Cu(I)/Ag(I) efflux system membrane fusion protein